QADPKFQKDYKAEYKKMKAKLALLEAKVSDDEEVTQVKVLSALADDELTVGKKQRLNLLSKYNKMVFELNKCRDELLILKQAKLTKLNHALQEQLKEEKKMNEKWLTSSKMVSQCISEQIPHQKKKVLGGELFTESPSKMNENENLFIPASMGYDQEMVPKTKDWVERLNPDRKLPNFNTGRILVPESQAVNESLEPTETLNTPESSKDSEAESLTPLPPPKILQGASPSSEETPLTFQPHSPRERPGLGIMKHIKPETHNSSNKSTSGTVTVSETKQTTPSVPTEVNSNQKTQESNSNIQKAESSKSVDSSRMSQGSKPKVQNTSSSKSLRPKPIQKPQLNYDHFTSRHNHVIHIRGGVLAESSQSNESSIGVKCNTRGSTIHSITDHNEFDHFKRCEKIQAAKARDTSGSPFGTWTLDTQGV
ncbi:hypothetical protein Tco_0864753, partial [Tanacetum coccineum]